MVMETNKRDNPATPPAVAPEGGRWRKVWSVISEILKVLLPVGVTVWLVTWLFKRVNFHQVVEIVREGCDFRYIALMMLLTMLSFIIRGVRWGIQLRAVGVPKQSPVEESVSIFGAYSLNLLFPFLGEAWRCMFMAKRTRTPLTTIVGTDLGDRISDAVVIVALLILTLGVAHPVMMRFLDHYSVGRHLEHIVAAPYVWGGIILAAGIIWSLFHWWGRLKIVRKMEGGLEKIWHGFVVLFHLDGIGMYILLTFGIWICYFLETYFCFYAFPFTRALVEAPGSAWGLIPGLVVFVFGSCSVAVPSNGGLGPWNIAVMFALSLYGISQTEGAAYSVVVWSCQTLMIIALGIFSAIYISLTSRRRHAASSSSPAK